LLAVIPAALALACLSPASFAQSYPTKTVKIIAPVAPGGGVDLVARTMADRYTKALGQTFIVENQSGGGGVIASQATARAAPDGYILMLGYVGTHGTNPAVRKVPYDAVKDFTPIAMVGGTPNVRMRIPRSLWEPEGAERIREEPGELRLRGRSTLTHPWAAQATGEFQSGTRRAGACAPPIDPWGQTQVCCRGWRGVGHIKSGKINPIAVTGLKHPLLPICRRSRAGTKVSTAYSGTASSALPSCPRRS
jgi:hypothetical protein